jgi:hypothetical protein
MLSLRIGSGSPVARPRPRSSSSWRSHSACRTASVEARTSAWVVDRATVGCGRLFQATVPPYVLNTYPVADRLVSRQPPQSDPIATR